MEHWYEKHADGRPLQDRVADGITDFAGSLSFIYIHAVIFLVWCWTGLFGLDHFPFNLLTLAVSLEAIFLSTFVMIGQNRQSDRDRAQADADYHTNLEAKVEIEEIQERLSRLEIEKLDKIISLLEK